MLVVKQVDGTLFIVHPETSLKYIELLHGIPGVVVTVLTRVNVVLAIETTVVSRVV
jgi:hypothetical protein